MNLVNLPWVEIAVLVALAGALCVSRVQDAYRASEWGLAFTAAAFASSVAASFSYYFPPADTIPIRFSRSVFGLDELSAPLLPLLALLHFLTALTTARTKTRRFSFSWSLASEAIRLATFGCLDHDVLVGLLVLGMVPPLVELRNRRKPMRIFAFHTILWVGLLVVGWVLIATTPSGIAPSTWSTVPLLLGILIRCGICPLHCWVTDWFEHASFGNALLFCTPLIGVYAGLRLAYPVVPDGVLETAGLVTLLTAVYSAGMATIQLEGRRLFAYLYLSNSSLVLIGLELHSVIALTGALCLWVSSSLSLVGFGLTLRGLEARVGRLTLGEFHGLYDLAPTLAVCFLITGLASVGFPGTLGFVAADLLVDAAVEEHKVVGGLVIMTSALNGIAVIRAYFLLFTGTRHSSSIALNIGDRERVAVLTLAVLLIGGGLYPQLNVSSRHKAAAAMTKARCNRLNPGDLGQPDPQGRPHVD